MALESMKQGLGIVALAAIQGCAVSATNSLADASVSDVASVDVNTDAGNRDVNTTDVLQPFDASLRRELHLLLSGSSARPGSTITAVAYLTDNARVVSTDEIRLAMDGGDADLGRIGERGYDRADGEQSSVIMDKVCYGNEGDTGNRYPNTLLPSIPGNEFGTVRIVRSTQPCPEHFTDSGLRTAKVYISNAMRPGVVKSIRASALSVVDQPEVSEGIAVVDQPWGNLADTEIRVSSEVVMPGGETVVMIAARDGNGFGLGCTQTPPEASFQGATSTSREPIGANTNGCTTERNSVVLPAAETISINTSHIAPGTRGYLTIFPGRATNLQVFARGQGLTDSDDEWSLHGLGNGMYILPMRATNVRDRGQIVVWYGNTVGAGNVAEPLVRVNIGE